MLAGSYASGAPFRAGLDPPTSAGAEAGFWIEPPASSAKPSTATIQEDGGIVGGYTIEETCVDLST